MIRIGIVLLAFAWHYGVPVFDLSPLLIGMVVVMSGFDLVQKKNKKA